MTPGPSPQITQDPRFETVLAKALAKHGVPSELDESVRRLVTGAADPRTFVCCDSGCSPCMKDYLRAAEQVITKLNQPEGQGSRPWWAFWRRG